MTSQPDNSRGSGRSRTVVVVGGGVSGLAAAHRLVELRDRAGLDLTVRLVEAADRLGGSIETTRQDGFLVEGGPDSFITQKPWALALAKRLGLANRLIPTNDACRRTFVVRKGRLLPVPEGFMMMAPTRWWPMVITPLFSLRGKLRMGLDLILPRGPDRSDESLASFVTRRLGREVLERLAQPMVGGIYTADPAHLSLRATLPNFLKMEQEHRSLILGMRAAQKRAAGASKKDSGARYSMFVSFDAGMTVLVEAIAARLGDGVARTSAPVSALHRNGNDSNWRVTLASGESIDGDAVILTTPGHQTARILAELDDTLSGEVGAIDYASSATISLAYRRDQIGHALDGFGFVAPAVEGLPLIAGSFSSVKFAGRAPKDHVLLRAFAGGALHAREYERSDDDLVATVHREMSRLLAIRGEPMFTSLKRHPKSMPQYPVGHLDRVARIDARVERHPGLRLAGNAFGGVGIPDCVRSGEQAAERVLADLGLGDAITAGGAT